MTLSRLTSADLDEFESLVRLAQFRAADRDEELFSFLVNGDGEEVTLSTGELDRRARALAATLQGAPLPGERALLLLPPGLEFIVAFFGCLYAGVVAVPVMAPALGNLARGVSRIEATIEDCKPAFVLTTRRNCELMAEYVAHLPRLSQAHWIDVETVDVELKEAWRDPEVKGHAIAFLQYTSGSGSKPKGVKVTHQNVLSNSRKIQQYFRHSLDSRGVIWLPPYHDMGLIGGILQPLYVGFPVTLMSPFTFLQQPFLWLKTISRKRASTSGAPDFAYNLCVRRISPEQRAQLDLSCWRVAFTGAEPVRAETLDRFAAAFRECGFSSRAWYPCYGLAESTLIVAGGPCGRAPIVKAFDAAALRDHRVVEAAPDDPHPRRLVACGQVSAGERLAIVDPRAWRRCAPNTVGEVWVASPSVAAGFWQMPKETAETFDAQIDNELEQRYLRTGDMGFVFEGELFLTGRLKNIIIIDGRNHHAEDIERTTEKAHKAIRPGGVVALSSEDYLSGQVLVVAELEPNVRCWNTMGSASSGSSLTKEVARAIRQLVAWEHDITLDRIVFLKSGWLPRTTSGKVRRHACLSTIENRACEIVKE